MTGWMGDDKHGENNVLADAYQPLDPAKVAIVRRLLVEGDAMDLAEMMGVA